MLATLGSCAPVLLDRPHAPTMIPATMRGFRKVALKASMEQFMSMAPGETYWAASDIGWATLLQVDKLQGNSTLDSTCSVLVLKRSCTVLVLFRAAQRSLAIPILFMGLCCRAAPLPGTKNAEAAWLWAHVQRSRPVMAQGAL